MNCLDLTRARLMRNSCTPHELRRRYSRVVLPRVGVGGGVRVGVVLAHASLLTEGAVDNSAAATITTTSQAACESEIQWWLR